MSRWHILRAALRDTKAEVEQVLLDQAEGVEEERLAELRQKMDQIRTYLNRLRDSVEVPLDSLTVAPVGEVPLRCCTGTGGGDFLELENPLFLAMLGPREPPKSLKNRQF